jgi:hypothetical protein
MPDLHAMSIAIRDGAARIAILEARATEQDGKIDTLQRLHESLRREIVARHPSFPLPDPPANATSLLLDQSVPTSLSPPESQLVPLIDLMMADLAPTPPKFEDASSIEGLTFEPSQVQLAPDPSPTSEVVQPQDPDTMGDIVDPGDLSNLVPEYDSSNDMDVEVDVEVKVEVSSEEVDMST